MTLAVTLLHRSIVSNAYSCGWSRSWKNSVVDVELQVRGSVNTHAGALCISWLRCQESLVA